MLAIPVAALTGLAFAAPIAAFAATQRTPDTVHGDLPLRDHAAVPVLGHVLPDRGPADVRPADRLADAAVPRRRAGARPVARHDRRVADASARPGAPRDPAGASSSSARSSRSARSATSWCADDRLPADLAAADRQPAVAARSSSATCSSTGTAGWSSSRASSSRCSTCSASASGSGRWSGTVPGPGGQEIPYQLFVAPALLASASMNGAINESTFNFFFKLNYDKTYDAILSTPLCVRRRRARRAGLGAHPRRAVRDRLPRRDARARARRVAVDRCSRSRPRCSSASRSPRSGWPPRRSCGRGRTSTSSSSSILPLFLFSATFYPIETYPEALRVVVQLTPLYHGVDLIRSLAVGAISPVLLVHVAYLTVMGLIGLAVVSRRLDKLLLK